MPSLHFSTTIKAPPQAVFDRLADFAHYDNWLPSSNLFKTVMEITDNPVQQGTKYVDNGLHGEVTVCQPPQNLTFHQVTNLKLLGFIPAGLDITIAYQLKADEAGTDLTRDVTVQMNGALKLLQFMLVRSIAAENRRILAALKLGLEQSA
ncbi:MAG: SRPBCC family protein [Anaerolineae bacterium]|nr:SRPBCC family protein [Anaerolineae bacterium]